MLSELHFLPSAKIADGVRSAALAAPSTRHGLTGSGRGKTMRAIEW